MEVYERIRELRKKKLHLSQTEFGKRLGVSRDVIKNIELNALARPDQKLSLMKLICKEFSVNEEWLLNGVEPIFIEPDTFSLDEYIEKRGGTDLEIEIVKTYFELDPETRKLLVQHFKNHFMQAAPAAAPSEKDPEEMTVEEAEAIYKSSLSSAQNTGYAALSTEEDTQRKKA